MFEHVSVLSSGGVLLESVARFHSQVPPVDIAVVTLSINMSQSAFSFKADAEVCGCLLVFCAGTVSHHHHQVIFRPPCALHEVHVSHSFNV